MPQVVAYDVASGTQIASLNYSGLKANFFADNVAVSNGGFLVAVVVGLEVVVWEPLKGDDAWSVQFKVSQIAGA